MLSILVMSDNNDIGLEWLSVDLDHLSPSQLLTSTPSWIFKYLHLGKDRRNIVVVRMLHSALLYIMLFRTSYVAFQHMMRPEKHKLNLICTMLMKMQQSALNIVALSHKWFKMVFDVLLENGFFAAIPEEKITTRFDGVNVDIIGYFVGFGCA